MGKEIGYGEFSCYLTTNESISTNQTKEECKKLDEELK
jgi:hypothetical protein